jgi:hypothetical protein
MLYKPNLCNISLIKYGLTRVIKWSIDGLNMYIEVYYPCCNV